MAKKNEDNALTDRWETKRVKLSQLTPFEHNPRRATKEQFDRLITSIQRFGYHALVMATHDLRVIDGHHRLKALRQLGFKDIEVRVATEPMPDEMFKEMVVRANVNYATWDADLLAAQYDVAELIEYGIPEAFFDGYTPEEQKQFNTDEDEAPPPPKVAKSKLGDIYILGNHRLMCGDSTDNDAIKKLMDGKKADMVFTDPPYGVSIGDKNKMLNKMKEAMANRVEENIKNDTLSPEKLKIVLLAAFKNAYTVLDDCCAVYVAAPQGGGLGMMMMMMMRESGLEVRHILNWIKNNATFSMGKLDYDYQHEPILFTWKKTHKKIMKGQHKTSCWFVDKPRESKLHPTMKPIEIPENAILNSSEEKDIVLDIFGGAGSTLIACEKTDRHARLMELDPIYVDVIVKRWEDFTGKTAELLPR